MKLKTENLEKVFRTDLVETVALNGVSIDVNDGEFVAVMGLPIIIVFLLSILYVLSLVRI